MLMIICWKYKLNEGASHAFPATNVVVHTTGFSIVPHKFINPSPFSK